MTELLLEWDQDLGLFLAVFRTVIQLAVTLVPNPTPRALIRRALTWTLGGRLSLQDGW